MHFSDRQQLLRRHEVDDVMHFLQVRRSGKRPTASFDSHSSGRLAIGAQLEKPGQKELQAHRSLASNS